MSRRPETPPPLPLNVTGVVILFVAACIAPFFVPLGAAVRVGSEVFKLFNRSTKEKA